MNRMLKLAAIIFLTLAIFASGAWATDLGIKYATVGGGATTKDGDSWATAFDAAGLATYLNTTHVAGIDVEIWVAAGTYSPGTGATGTFHLAKGVKLYGGFAGTETILTQRNWVANPTILSMSGAGRGEVVVASGNGADPEDTRLDGFIVTGGSNDSSGRGGGMRNIDSSPTITNCTFVGNTADYGGGMYNDNSSHSVITNCTFAGNTATMDGGGDA